MRIVSRRVLNARTESAAETRRLGIDALLGGFVDILRRSLVVFHRYSTTTHRPTAASRGCVPGRRVRNTRWCTLPWACAERARRGHARVPGRVVGGAIARHTPSSRVTIITRRNP